MRFSQGYPESYAKGDCTLETICRDAELDWHYSFGWIPQQWWDAHRQADQAALLNGIFEKESE